MMEEYENVTVDRYKQKSNFGIIIGLIAAFFIFLILVIVITDPVISISVNPSVALSTNPLVAFVNLFYVLVSDYLYLVYIVIIIVLFFVSFVEYEKFEFLKKYSSFFEFFKKYRFILIVALLSGCLTQITVNVLKVLVARPRPYETFPALIHIFSHLSTSSSFPSGHTASAFGFLLPIILYQNKSWKKVPILLIPIAVGFSRLYLGVHYLSDVISGMIIAVVFVVGTAIIMFKTKDKKPPKISKYTLYFIICVIILGVFLFCEAFLG